MEKQDGCVRTQRTITNQIDQIKESLGQAQL